MILPSAAANLARLTHAPEIVLIYESGCIGTKPIKTPHLDRLAAEGVRATSSSARLRSSVLDPSDVPELEDDDQKERGEHGQRDRRADRDGPGADDDQAEHQREDERRYWSSRTFARARPPMATAEVGVIRLITPDADWYAVMKSRPTFRPLLAERMEVITPPTHYDKVDF